MAVLGAYPRFRAFDDDGNPLAGGKLYTYAQGTSTPKTTYTDSTLGTANTNPVILDAAGEADVWLSGNYKFALYSSADALQWTIDGIPGTDGAAIAIANVTSESGAAQIALYDAIPAAARVLGVYMVIVTTFGNSQGLTTLSIGDTISDDRWGRGIARTAGTQTTMANWRDGSLPIYPTGEDVVLVAEGGTFDAIGSGRVIVIYTLLTAVEAAQETLSGIQDPGTVEVATRTITSSSGSVVATVADAIPDSARVYGVFLTIETAFGNSQGLTGLRIGDSVFEDRWGAGIARTAGTATSQGDFRDTGGTPIYSADEDILVTAEGGAFDGTGSGTLYIVYAVPNIGE